MRSIISGIVALALLVFSTGQTPDEPPGPHLLKQARALLDSAQYEEALKGAQAALVYYADSSAAKGQCLLLLGNIFLETGQWDAAYQQFNAALLLFENHPEPGRLNAAQAHNNLGEYFYKKDDYAQAAAQHQLALNIRLAALGRQHELVADSYNNLGNCRAALGDYIGATKFHQDALDIRQKVLPDNHPDRATSLNNLGNCAYLNADYPTALQYFQQALLLRQKAFGPEHPKTAQVLNNLGNACAALGRQQAAIRYYEAALNIRRKAFGNQHPSIANALENIADLHTDWGDPLTALDLYRQAYAIQRSMQGEDSPAAASLWHKIGLCYQYEGDFKRALEHHNQSFLALTKALGPNHPYIAGLHNNIGNCLLGQKNFQGALHWYREALHRFQQNRPLPYPSIAQVFNNLGTANLEAGQAQQALQALDQALLALQASPYAYPAERAVYLKNKGLALEKLGRWKDAQTVFAAALAGSSSAEPIARLEIQMAWAGLQCRHQLQADKPVALLQSLQLLEQSLALGDSLRSRLLAPGSRQHWLNQRAPALNLAMEALFRLWEQTQETELLERAFALAERNQSLRLLEQARKEQAERFAGIPDSLLEQERQLAEQLNQLEKRQIAQRQAEAQDQAQALDLQISDTRQAYHRLLRHFETQYPDYYRLQFDQQTATPTSVRRNLLQTDQALVEYFQGDSALFVFTISMKQLHFQRIAQDVSLTESVRQLRQSLQYYPAANSETAALYAQKYAEQAHGLYTRIFAPLEKSATLPPKLILVPDGPLAYLPFECLLRQMPADVRLFKSHDYLLRHFQIAYAYSATQQLELLGHPQPLPSRQLLAVAPTFENNRYGLQALQNNRTEAQAVVSLFDGELLEGEQATVAQFLEKAGAYRILLLATHGQASSAIGELSYLAFSTSDSTDKPFLYARDLYTQRFPAEMVVLSACETSLGDYQAGQGVVSLAKGFFHAGARSVVASLWSIDDAKNSELVQLFFQHIQQEMPKDAALRQAKLDFLKKQPHNEACPVYWAALTAYGDMQAIESSNFWVWCLGMVGLLVIVTVFWRRRFPSKKSRIEHL